jgi:hypothetical protein
VVENVRFGEIVSVRRGESCSGELHGLIHVKKTAAAAAAAAAARQRYAERE